MKNTTTQSKRIEVSIVRETPKALLVKNGDREGWIQRRWLRTEDNTVNRDTFERSAQRKQQQVESDQCLRDYKNSYQPLGKIIRESAKAVMVNASVEIIDIEKVLTRGVWFPKSQLNETGTKIKGWLILAKARDLREELSRGRNLSITLELCNLAQ